MSALMAAGAGAVAGVLAIPAIAGATFVHVPLAAVGLGLALIVLWRLFQTADLQQRPRIRSAWKASLWLLVASIPAFLLLDGPGIPVVGGLAVWSALVAVGANEGGDRVLLSN
jgi:hypothetical protein